MDSLIITMNFCVEDTIDSIKQDNEGYDPEFKLELTEKEKMDILASLEDEIELVTKSAGEELIQERLKEIWEERKAMQTG